MLEYSPVIQETGVQSQVESYQRHKKWYLIPPCLTLSIIRNGSRVKWRNPRTEEAPSSTPRCSSYWKGSLRYTLNYGRQLYFYIYIYVCVCVWYGMCVCVCERARAKLELWFWIETEKKFPLYNCTTENLKKDHYIEI